MTTVLFLFFLNFDTAPHKVVLLTLNSLSDMSSLAPERGMDEMTLNTILFLLRVKGRGQGIGKEGLQMVKSSSAGLEVTERSSAPTPTPTDSGWSLVFPTPSLTKVPQQLGLSSAAQPFHILKAQRTSPQVSHFIPAWAGFPVSSFKLC